MKANMSWLSDNKNKNKIQKLLESRDKLVIDITVNNKYVKDYQRKLKRITNKIEKLYLLGV